MLTTAHSRVVAPDSGSPSAGEVQSYLRELLESEGFTTSERNRSFLSYVVQETLEGRADRIKAYSIAIAAFDRNEDFDPLTDPIVRIEAGRLRRSLEHYYLTAGQRDRIRIDIPKGSYAATFSYQEPQQPQSEAPSEIAEGRSKVPVSLQQFPSTASFSLVRLAAVMTVLGAVVGSIATYGITNHVEQISQDATADGRPSIFVAPFMDTSGSTDRGFLARGLTYDVSAALTQLENVAVLGSSEGMVGNAGGQGFASDFTLFGSVQADQHRMRVAVFLADSRTRQLLRSWTFQKDLTASDTINAQMGVAQQILASLREQCAYNGSFDCRPLAVAAK